MQGVPSSSSLNGAAWPSLAAAAAVQEPKKKAVRYRVPVTPSTNSSMTPGPPPPLADMQQQHGPISYANMTAVNGQYQPAASGSMPYYPQQIPVAPGPAANGVSYPPALPPGLFYPQPTSLPNASSPTSPPSMHQKPMMMMYAAHPPTMAQPPPSSPPSYAYMPPPPPSWPAQGQGQPPPPPLMHSSPPSTHAPPQAPMHAIVYYPMPSSQHQHPYALYPPPGLARPQHVAGPTSPPTNLQPPSGQARIRPLVPTSIPSAPPGLTRITAPRLQATPSSSSHSATNASESATNSARTTASPSTTVNSHRTAHRVTSSSHLPEPQAEPEPPSSPVPLDRYARVYVPAWLKAVNADPNFTAVPLQEGEGDEGKLDFDAYAKDVWPRRLWTKLEAGAAEEKDDRQVELEHTSESWLPPGGAGEGEALEGDGDVTVDDVDNFDPTYSPPVPQYSPKQSTHSPSAEAKPHARTYDPEDPDSHPPPALSGVAALGARSYAEHFVPLLTAESKHREEELADCAVYAQQLKVYSRNQTAWDQDGLYRLALPGIREERPRLVAGDRAYLRPLASTAGEGESGWLHLQFEVRVTAVRAVQGEIIISCPTLSSRLSSLFSSVEDARFNVTFVYNGRLIAGATELVQSIGRRLPRSQWWRRTLFPTVEDARTNMSGSPLGCAWRDPTLNREQRAAVTAIATHSHSMPFLLSGPPGTGKTKTCVEAILQLVARDPTNRILVVAPSNAASDVLALRLADHLKQSELLRLNDPTRTFAEVPERLSLFCCVDGPSYTLPPWEKLMAARVVVTASHDVSMLLQSRSASNVDLGELQLGMLPGMLKVDDPRPLPHWTHLIVDEAAQGTEPDLAAALSTVAPHPRTRVELWPTVVLVGDPAQLGPQVRNSDARAQGLDVSLLERLARRPVYSRALAKLKKNARALVLGGGGGGSSSSSSSTAAASHPHCGHLIRNYRARHPALLHLPSTLFYSDSLVPCARPTPRSISALSWPWLQHNAHRPLRDQLPLLFVDVKGQDEWVDEGVSWYNEDEAKVVVEACLSLVRGNVVPAESIAVITPFREQVWQIRLRLRQVGLASVAVGPVEALQGQEAPVVIISAVRSRARFLARDREAAQGIVGESKRLNVALTRARELCVLVGNGETLEEGCGEWREVTRHARRNGWVRREGGAGAGVEEGESNGVGKGKLGDDDTLISALESAERAGHGWWRRMLGEEAGVNGVGHAAEQGEEGEGEGAEERMGILAGRMATVALQDDEQSDGDDA